MRVKLEEVCERGTSNIKQSDIINKFGDYPIYGAAGYIGNVDFYHQDKPYVAIVKDGAGIGRATLHPGKSSVIGTMQYLLPKDNIRPEYLCYVVRHMHLEKYFTGATIPHIYFRDYKNEEFNLDDLNKQTEIVSVLEKVETIIAKRKQVVQKYDDLIKARFVEIFGDPVSNPKGWDCCVLTEVCSSILGGGTPSKSHPEYFTGNIPWVSPKDMKSSVISDSIDHITEDAINQSTTNLVPENSVLMVIRSGILKHTLPVAINSVPVTINQDMKAFVPNGKITASYLMHYFKSIEQDVLSGVRSVTADNIDFRAFQKRLVILPPLVQQQQFASFVEQVDKSKVIGLNTLRCLQYSLMPKFIKA
jgi:type I restriction enzyme S subunit